MEPLSCFLLNNKVVVLRTGFVQNSQAIELLGHCHMWDGLFPKAVHYASILAEEI